MLSKTNIPIRSVAATMRGEPHGSSGSPGMQEWPADPRPPGVIERLPLPYPRRIARGTWPDISSPLLADAAERCVASFVRAGFESIRAGRVLTQPWNRLAIWGLLRTPGFQALEERQRCAVFAHAVEYVQSGGCAALAHNIDSRVPHKFWTEWLEGRHPNSPGRQVTRSTDPKPTRTTSFVPPEFARFYPALHLAAREQLAISRRYLSSPELRLVEEVLFGALEHPERSPEALFDSIDATEAGDNLTAFLDGEWQKLNQGVRPLLTDPTERVQEHERARREWRAVLLHTDWLIPLAPEITHLRAARMKRCSLLQLLHLGGGIIELTSRDSFAVSIGPSDRAELADEMIEVGLRTGLLPIFRVGVSPPGKFNQDHLALVGGCALAPVGEVYVYDGAARRQRPKNVIGHDLAHYGQMSGFLGATASYVQAALAGWPYLEMFRRIHENLNAAPLYASLHDRAWGSSQIVGLVFDNAWLFLRHEAYREVFEGMAQLMNPTTPQDQMLMPTLSSRLQNPKDMGASLIEIGAPIDAASVDRYLQELREIVLVEMRLGATA